MNNELIKGKDFPFDDADFFRRIFENARVNSIIILTTEGTILAVNKVFENTYGYTPEELIGKNFSMFYTEDDRMKNIPQRELGLVLDKGSMTDTNYLVHKNGNLIWVSGESIRSEVNNTTYVVKFVFDIHEQKKLEEVLIQTNDELNELNRNLEELYNQKEAQATFYETILANAADFIYSFDLEGRFTYVNKPLLEVWGISYDEAIGKTFKEFGYPDDLVEKHKKQIETIISTKEPIRDENFFQGKEGVRYYEYIFSPIFDGENITGIAGTTRDITHRHHLETDLREKNVLLNRINNDLDNFVYTASHDLKGPMGNIEGLLETLQYEMSPENKENSKEIIKMMFDSVYRFQEVLNDLSKIAKEKTKDIGEVYFYEMIEEAELSLVDLIKKYHPVFVQDLSKAPSLKFSRKNLRSIVQNLLSNAIKYSSPERRPQIKIHTENVNGYVLLEVEDNGIGIKEEDKGKVFTMYQRMHDHVEGSGVGMGIVKRIVDNAGGKIEIQSEVGKGSVFKVYLPKK